MAVNVVGVNHYNYTNPILNPFYLVKGVCGYKTIKRSHISWCAWVTMVTFFLQSETWERSGHDQNTPTPSYFIIIIIIMIRLPYRGGIYM